MLCTYTGYLHDAVQWCLTVHQALCSKHPAVKQQGRTLTLTARCGALYIALCIFWAMQCNSDCPLPLHWAYPCESKRKHLPFLCKLFFWGHFFLWTLFSVGTFSVGTSRCAVRPPSVKQQGAALFNSPPPFDSQQNYHRVICLSTFF